MTAVNVADLRDLIHWLSDGGRSAQTAAEFFRQTCERLVAAGVPLWRARVFVHSVFDRSFIWRLGEDVQMEIADSIFRIRCNS
jgi:adenylate cyclase